jgi:hypothetical protein
MNQLFVWVIGTDKSTIVSVFFFFNQKAPSGFFCSLVMRSYYLILVSIKPFYLSHVLTCSGCFSLSRMPTLVERDLVQKCHLLEFGV